MRNAIVGALALMTGILGQAGAAKGQDFGLGFIFSQPTGLSLKVWSSPRAAVDAGFAWRDDMLSAHADLLIHRFLGTGVRHSRLAVYYGAGFRMVDGGRRLGVRLPLGLTYLLGRLPLDIFLEVVPVMDFKPGTRFGFLWGGGFRVYLL